MHESTPVANEKSPALQSTHAFDSAAAEYFPVEHATHTGAPVTEYQPATQTAHAVEPVKVWYFPEEQAVHAGTPMDEYFPAAQDKHVLATAAPVVGENLPASH